MNFFDYLTEAEVALQTVRKLAGQMPSKSFLDLEELEATVRRLQDILENLVNDRPWRFRGTS